MARKQADSGATTGYEADAATAENLKALGFGDGT